MAIAALNANIIQKIKEESVPLLLKEMETDVKKLFCMAPVQEAIIRLSLILI